MEIKLNYEELEKLTGLKNIKYKSRNEVSSDFILFKKNIKILRINV